MEEVQGTDIYDGELVLDLRAVEKDIGVIKGIGEKQAEENNKDNRIPPRSVIILKRVIVKSVHRAFGYDYPFGMAVEAAEQGTLTDTYAVISIQDSHTHGFVVQFTENQFCKDVITLMFDDIVT